ncbi:hypothetical protein [Micromonospora chalcea]|uniref:hypothetical protein n=1 Tax=Micromonospora chalcea TaxID=1874 RepID=UPI00332DC277
MSGILVRAITAATKVTPNSIALLHRTLGGRPHGRVCISCTSPRTCEQNEWAESYIAQVVADAAARGSAS